MIFNWSPGSFLGRPVEHAEPAKRALVRPLRARQDTTPEPTAALAAATESAESTAAASSTESAAASESGDTAAASSPTAASGESSAAGNGTDISLVASATQSVGVSTDAQGNIQVSYITIPPWTATSYSAYSAHGVNTTHPFHPTSATHVLYPGLEPTTTSTHSSTTTHSAAGAWATEWGVPKNELTKCSIDGKNNTWGPFCNPDNNQRLWVGYKYAFTWNGDLFPANNTNRIQLEYTNKDLGNATVGDPWPNYLGYFNFEMDEAWLQGADGNSSDSGQNMTVILISSPADGSPDQILPGPLVSLVRNPATLPKIPYKKIAPKYGLEIGLPVGLAALCIIIFSFCCAYRRRGHRIRDVRHIGQDYMAKRQRRRGGKGAAIQLDEMDVSSDTSSRYTDQPTTGGGGNAFRDEIKRQREEDDASRRGVTSF